MAKKSKPPVDDFDDEPVEETTRAVPRGAASASAEPGEDEVDRSLRPERFDDFTGQERVKENLRVYVRAAQMRKKPLDHVLLSGPPGLGKTTLARIIATELGVDYQGTSAPALKRPGDLVGLLAGLPENCVLFIDEIHRLPAAFEEYLYSAMEDGFIDVAVDQGPSARSVRFNLKPFTLIGATTRDGLLSRPFQDRFGIPQKLSFYTNAELSTIITRSAGILGCGIDPVASDEISRRARKTPRIANRLLRRLRDWADVEGNGKITVAIAKKGLEKEGVDESGLDSMDRRILQAIAGHHGNPAGVKTIAVIVGEEEGTIEDVYEPFLIQEGYVLKTPRGRVLTGKGYERLGLKTPAQFANQEPGLF